MKKIFMSKAEQREPKLPTYGDYNNVKYGSIREKTRRKPGEIKATIML